MKAALALGAAAALISGVAHAQAARAPAPEDPIAAERIKPFQYLYGSGEGGAISIQAWHGLLEFARAQVMHRPEESVVLANDSTLDQAHFVPCGKKPFAAVFDVDETAILNLGLEEHDAAGDRLPRGALRSWTATGANAVAPVPGAVTAIAGLRKLGVTVIFNTNRGASGAEGTAAALRAAGLGEAVHGQTLFLSGDDAMGPRKDGRRWTIAAKYCVIAMAGDQLGDFSDLFNAKDLSVAERRQAAIHGWAAQLWGNGWFVLPNPIYGTALQGGIDDIFPADKRWNAAGN